MVKVRMSPQLFDYRQDMKECLRQVIQWNYIDGVRESGRSPISLVDENLLPPPRILAVVLEEYEGQGDDFIGVSALNDFGIESMKISVWSDCGELIECGDASPFIDDPELWEFYPTVHVPAGTAVVVQAVATDCMGGIGVSREWKTLGESD